MRTIKVSFDFDDTLSRDDVQKYAKKLISNGIEVWICTSRTNDDYAQSSGWNNDLLAISDSLGIQMEHIKFCPMSAKYVFFKNKDFIFHLDDDMTEIKMINKFTTTNGINLFGNKQWMYDCDKILERAISH